MSNSARIVSISCLKVEFSKKNERGRPQIREIAGSEFEIDADLAILAIGFIHPEHKGLLAELETELDASGNVKTDHNYQTSIKGMFSAGDTRRGQSLIVLAISEGRAAARAIDKYLMD